MWKWTHFTLVKGITSIFRVTKMIANGTFSPDLTWSLTTLPWVSPFHNLSHALTSWQLISHAFSQSRTPKKFWRCSHLLPGKISIDSKHNPKKTLSVRVRLHSFSLPWWPLHATKINVQTWAYCFSFLRWPPLQNLNHKIKRDVYCCSFSAIHVIMWLPIPIIPTGSTFHLKIWDISQLFTHLPQ